MCMAPVKVAWIASARHMKRYLRPLMAELLHSSQASETRWKNTADPALTRQQNPWTHCPLYIPYVTMSYVSLSLAGYSQFRFQDSIRCATISLHYISYNLPVKWSNEIPSQSSGWKDMGPCRCKSWRRQRHPHLCLFPKGLASASSTKIHRRKGETTQDEHHDEMSSI